MRRLLLGTLAFAAAASVTLAAQAHLRLTSPPPRHPDDLKTGPCGLANDARGTVISYFEPGAQITVEWDEYIQHPGHFRIMFDDDGSDFPKPANENDFCTDGTMSNGVYCIDDNIPDQTTSLYSQTITLPNIECNNCTLQAIQYMTDKLNDGIDNEIYYQCADLVLQVGAGGGPATTSSSSGGTTTGAGGAGATTGAGAGGTPNGIDPSPVEDDGGCSCRLGGPGDGAAPLAAAALGLLLLGARRKRG